MQFSESRRAQKFLIFAVASWALCAAARSEPHAIDTKKSVMTVHVYKSGVLSGFAHDHVITAPVASGNVDTQARRVSLQVNATSLKVNDPKGSEKDHDEIQKTMLGPQVLDVEQYPKIEFESTSAEAAGEGSWTVRGDLTLHGQKQPVTVQVVEKAGRYTGSTLVKQRDFGIKPIKIAGGTVQVKDEVRVEFEIELAH
jgi:polyisoprenoid-binding protein YceI